MEFISLTEREKLIDILSEINFYSLTMGGSTDVEMTLLLNRNLYLTY